LGCSARAGHTRLIDIQNIDLEELQMVEFDTLQTWVLNRLDAKADEHYFDRHSSLYSRANTRLGLDMPPNNLQSSQTAVIPPASLPHHSIRSRFQPSEVPSNIAPISLPHQTTLTANMDDLSRRLQALTLQIELAWVGNSSTSTAFPSATNSQIPASLDPARFWTCFYCNAQGHNRNMCASFAQDCEARIIHLDHLGKVWIQLLTR
jgi:hypothetical protein